MSKIKILIADDHKILRQGIRSLLAPHSDFEVIGETADGPETLKETFKLDFVDTTRTTTNAQRIGGGMILIPDSWEMKPRWKRRCVIRWRG